MKKNNLVLLAILLTSSIQAQLPPVFGAEYNDKTSHSDLVKTYITPQKIIWQSDDSGEFIKNATSLLNKGNGQVAVNDKNLCRFISSEESKPGFLYHFFRPIKPVRLRRKNLYFCPCSSNRALSP